MTIENILLSISTKVLGWARIKFCDAWISNMTRYQMHYRARLVHKSMIILLSVNQNLKRSISYRHFF